MIKLYLPGCELHEFIKLFDLLYQYLRIEKCLYLNNLVDGKNLIKNIYGSLDFLKTYNPLVTPKSYFIIEDSICHHGIDDGPNPGPYEALKTFMNESCNFEIDRTKEAFFITWNPKGFLKRIN